MAFAGSVIGSWMMSGSNGNLNKLCIKNTANEYLDNSVTSGNALTCFTLEHNSNSANDLIKMNGNSYHKKKSYPRVNA